MSTTSPPAAAPPVPSALASMLPALLLALLLAALAQGAAGSRWLAGWPQAQTLLGRLLVSAAALAAAAALLRLTGWLLWDRLVPRQTGLRIPRLLRQFVAVLVFGAVLLGLLTQVWGVALTAVLATTGVLGLVLGLALRRILTDFFSGIALNIEQPFRLDDFILLHTRQRREPIAGLVREINWRSTRILTPEDNLVSVPNSVVASAVVENLSFPSPVSEQEVDIVLDWALPQGVVETLLGAAVTEAWMRGAVAGDKPPKVRICRLDGRGVAWRITYLLDPRRKAKGPARHELLSCVQRHLVLAGIRPVAEPGERGLPPPDAALPPAPPATRKVPEFDTADARRRVLDTAPLLASLSADERERLAAAMALREAARGQAVVERGRPGGSMFVLAAGVAEVRVADGHGAPQRAAVLGPGDSFGEMSLLTGEPRSAEVLAVTPLLLFEIDGALLAPLLAARPALADALSAAAAAHLQADARRRQAPEAAVAALSRPAQIAARIRALFRL